MLISDRQKDILNTVVNEYITSAQAVSSQLLEKKYDFGVCPATIRNEMQKLTDNGFLFQPHTSAGRVPTDKGYRFFVDNLINNTGSDFDMENWFENEIRDNIKFIQNLTKKLAHLSGSLALSYLGKEKVFWKEGWEEIIKEPEFSEKNFAANFAGFLENFESNIENFDIASGIQVYIGKENPFKSADDFSMISAKYNLPNEEGIISLLGPKRMAYDKNIGLINSLTKLLEDL
jgi:heat-inducible transcriptional repressor